MRRKRLRAGGWPNEGVGIGGHDGPSRIPAGQTMPQAGFRCCSCVTKAAKQSRAGDVKWLILRG
jgi:hypothetical protein